MCYEEDVSAAEVMEKGKGLLWPLPKLTRRVHVRQAPLLNRFASPLLLFQPHDILQYVTTESRITRSFRAPVMLKNRHTSRYVSNVMSELLSFSASIDSPTDLRER
jgi:hypothetical protein